MRMEKREDGMKQGEREGGRHRGADVLSDGKRKEDTI